MDRSLYLQILRHQTEPWHKSWLGYEYMGAAEFEWGSIPQAWRALRKAADTGTLLVGKTKDIDVKLRRWAKADLIGSFHLHYAACPTLGITHRAQPFDVETTLERLLRQDPKLRSHESPRLERVLSGDGMDGWLSVCPDANVGGSITRPIFVATPSEEFRELLLEKIRAWEPT